MAVIVGSSTQVTLQFPTRTVTAGISAVDWAFGSNINRLYTLGATSNCGVQEFASIRSSNVSVNFSIYSGEDVSIDVCPPAEGCVDSPARVIATIIPGICGTSTVESLISRAVYLNSYSYNKDRTGFATAQYAGTAYVQSDEADISNKKYIEPMPTSVVLGVSEGTIESEIDNLTTLEILTGAVFRDQAEVRTTSKGSVSASQMSLGEYSLIHSGIFRSVGGGLFGLGDPTYEGLLAKCSVNISTQPVYYKE